MTHTLPFIIGSSYDLGFCTQVIRQTESSVLYWTWLECGHMGSNLFEFTAGKNTSGPESHLKDTQHLSPPEAARTNKMRTIISKDVWYFYVLLCHEFRSYCPNISSLCLSIILLGFAFYIYHFVIGKLQFYILTQRWPKYKHSLLK